MGERYCVPNLRPDILVPDGASFYLMQINSSQGLEKSLPLHLLVSDVDQTSGQCIVPLLPSNTNINLKNSTNRILAPNSTSGQKAKSKIINQEKKVIVLSNKLITPSSHTFTPLASKVHNKGLKNVDTKSNQEDILQINKQKGSNFSLDVRDSNKEDINHVPNYVHIHDRVAPPRAVAVLPTALQMRRVSVYPKRALPPRVRFGPVQGVITKIFPAEADELVCESAINRQPLFLMKRDKDSVTHINVTDKDRSNWLSLLPLGDNSTANVWLYEEDGNLYGITTKLIPCRRALSLGYSRKYAVEHKLPLEQPVLDLDEALEEQPKWWCFECRRAFESSTPLLRHMNLCHKEERRPRKKFRCTCCSRTFCRMFTLRKHRNICTKKYMKPGPTTSETPQKRQDPEVGDAQIPEDNKIPSDESFLNYTSALDFSINLFDPDRIYNLDMSGSLKSEPEFNLNSTAPKFENFDNNEDYSKFCKGIQSENDDMDKAKQKECIVVCPHCEKTISKATKRRHLRQCPARRLECECGKVFTRKDYFVKHVHKKHNNTDIEKKSDNNMKMLAYKCEDCNMKFKRRGMLVNHLWRVHDKTSVEVPLERHVRHYPCSACPKIYRTAAKRDRHVKTNHPGASIRAAPIEGEKRVYEPAKCSACPREYVTRFKLLQHIRAQHPELAIPTKNPRLTPKSPNKPPSRKKPSLEY